MDPHATSEGVAVKRFPNGARVLAGGREFFADDLLPSARTR